MDYDYQENEYDVLEGKSFPIKARICLVDDCLTSAHVTKKSLSRHSYDVSHFTEAESALSALELGGFDLLVVDLQITTDGRLNGDRLIDVVRQLPSEKSANIPIIAVSESLSSLKRDALLKVGANEVICSDEKFNGLPELVAQHLYRSRFGQPNTVKPRTLERQVPVLHVKQDFKEGSQLYDNKDHIEIHGASPYYLPVSDVALDFDHIGLSTIRKSRPLTDSTFEQPPKPVVHIDHKDREQSTLVENIQAEAQLGANKQKTGRVWGLLGLLLIFVAGAWGGLYVTKPSLPITVDVVRAELKLQHNSISVPGQVVALETWELTAPQTGVLASLHIEPGVTVEKGQLIAQISEETNSRRIDELHNALTHVNRAISSEKAELDRLKQGVVIGVIPRKRYELAHTHLNDQKQKKTELQKQLNVLKVQKQVSPIYADQPGVVEKINRGTGERVIAGEILATLSSPNFEIRAPINGSRDNSLQTGQQVLVPIGNAVGDNWQGEVTRIENDVAVVSIGTDRRFHPGQEVNLEVVTHEPKHIVVLPKSLVVELDGLQQVGIIREGQLQYIPVKVGRDLGDKVEILRGIGFGQEVVELPELLVEGTKLARRAG